MSNNLFNEVNIPSETTSPVIKINKDNTLLTNAFNLLNIVPEDDINVLTDKYEDALFDGNYPEKELLKAQQTLLSSLSRLEQEIGWLLGISKEQLPQLNSPELSFITESWPPLAEINYLFYLFSFEITEAIFHRWITLWDNVSAEQICEAVNQSRQLSGFPQVSLEVVQQKLLQHKDKQVEQLTNNVVIIGNINPLLTAYFVKHNELKIDTDSVIFKMTDGNLSLVEVELEQQKEKIYALVDSLIATTDNTVTQTLLIQLREHLALWRKWVEPHYHMAVKQGYDTEGYTTSLLSNITNKFTDMFADKDERDNEVLCYLLSLAQTFIHVLNMLIKEVSLYDASDKQLGSLVDIVNKDILRFKARLALPDFSTEIDELVNEPDTFLKSIRHYQTYADETTAYAQFISRITSFLKKEPSHERRAYIYSLSYSLVREINNYIKSFENFEDIKAGYHSLIFFLKKMKKLVQSYPYSESPDQTAMNGFKSTQTQTVVTNSISTHIAIENFDGVIMLIDEWLDEFSDNPEQVELFKQLRTDLKKHESQKFQGSLVNILLFIYLIVQVMILLS